LGTAANYVKEAEAMMETETNGLRDAREEIKANRKD
jgi:hypothetical protein